MKIFLSQPMAGKEEKEILLERAYVTEFLKEKLGEDIEILHTYYDGPEPPLYKLGMAIQAMANADMVFFLPGWNESRGCKIEYQCAKEYKLDRYELLPMPKDADQHED